MKQIQFEDWQTVLAQADLPERKRRSWTITLRWYLSFCRRSRAGVNVQSARDFVAWAQEEKQAQDWMVEEWKEAIRWFFRAAPKGSDSSGRGGSSRKPPHSVQPPLSGQANKPSASDTTPTWKQAFLTVVRRRHYSLRTEQSYLVWIERFARHVKTQDLASRDESDIKGFLDALAVQERLSASSQRQALNALVFLFREVFGRELGDFSDYRRARARSHLPVWLTREEVSRLLDCLEGRYRLMAQVMYGGGCG